MSRGPAFLRFVSPVLETLKELGGSESPRVVIEEVVRRLGVSEQELAARTPSGQPRISNQIRWARFYLAKAGLIQQGRPGVWKLTPLARETVLDDDALLAMFRRIQSQYAKVAEETEGADPLPEEIEEIEAVQGGVEDEDEDEGSIHTPFDASKTQVVTKPMSVEQLAKRLHHEEIDLAPEFQRGAHLWSKDQKSRLIESMLIRIPLPVFYFDATDDAKWLVVDGLQRLSTIEHFMVKTSVREPLKLQGLEYLSQHEGKTFDELPRDLQRRIEETQVFAHLIQPGTPDEVKYNIFKRINTGGLVLTAQEIRHALCHKGGSSKFLLELATSLAFLDATDRAIANERMLDREFVLRFVSFSLTPYGVYTASDMDAFLNKHMRQLNEAGERGGVRDDLRRRFAQAMNAAQRIFGNDGFRKRYSADRGRNPINKALFDAWSVTLGKLDPAQIEALVARRIELIEAQGAAFRTDPEFEASITQGTGSVKRVHKRFSTVEQLVFEVLRSAP